MGHQLIPPLQGSHVAKALFDRGEFVRVADFKQFSAFAEPICHDTLIGNLCDSALLKTHIRAARSQQREKIQVRIARFHNIIGPRGSWNNRPRKREFPAELEIWGDGQQRRSFLYIDDCVEGVLKLLESSCNTPVNIGSDRSVTIESLAKIAVQCAGLHPEDVKFRYDTDSKPTGVGSRSSNNDLVKVALGWSPKISLEDGMKPDCRNVAGLDDSQRKSTLQMMQCSKVVDLTSSDIKFAILLPITSRGSNPPEDSSLKCTWRSMIDDDFLKRTDKKSGLNIAESVLMSQDICDVTIEVCKHPSGHVCAIWRQIAKRAWKEGCDYFVLMGDDVALKDEGWMRDAHAEFAQLAERMDISSTATSFPRYSSTKTAILSYISSRITNGIGGSQPARYHQQHAQGWTFATLDKATATAEQWLLRHRPTVSRKLTLDVAILNLKPSPSCTVMFIIIIDDPQSPARIELETKYASRPDVCIRTNDKNLGASASRNRGMKESAAEWIIYLDDDVTPRSDLLVEAEKVIRANPNAAGFVGNAQFPPAGSVFTTAVHLAGVTYFWDIAVKMAGEKDMPWGGTANLIARRIDDGVEYDLQFPKTGGGDDIDFCRRKREFSIGNGGEGFHAAPEVVVTHPWWGGGHRCYWHLYMRSKGDGGLIRLYPDLTYIDHAPNSAEILLISGILGSVGILTYLLSRFILPHVTIIANIVHDVYRHLYRERRQDERGEICFLGHRFDWFAHRAGEGPMNEERKNSVERMAVIVATLTVTLAMAYSPVTCFSYDFRHKML
ncbi:glycosyltransferase family 2 protein [Melanogaster broomeanus]|nr:glycosyltransferase family 2 protein [Melanogaster broomeanus]